MIISARIRQHVFNVPDGQPFATRDLLAYGPRGAVDKAIQRLIRAEVIVRVARGVFVKPIYEKGKLKLPTLAKVVLTKAHAFGKKLFIHGTDAACALNIIDYRNDEPTFVASGSSSSFLCNSADFGRVRVHFRGSSPLSQKFGDTGLGLIFRAMRALPSFLREPAFLGKVVEPFCFGRTQRREFREASKWMPGWLSKMLWIKGPVPRDTSFEPPSWDSLRKHMTAEEFAEFAAREIRPWVPPWIEFPPAPEPNWDLLWLRLEARKIAANNAAIPGLAQL